MKINKVSLYHHANCLVLLAGTSFMLVCFTSKCCFTAALYKQQLSTRKV